MESKKSGFPGRVLKWLVTSRLEEIPFIVLLSFLLTFVISRLYVYITNHDLFASLLPESVYVRGVHIHHFGWGIMLLAVVGYVSLYSASSAAHRLLAVFYGIGLGLTFDEFALWLRLRDDYYAGVTYDAVVVVGLVLLNIVYFPVFWSKMEKRIVRIFRFLVRRIYSAVRLISRVVLIGQW